MPGLSIGTLSPHPKPPRQAWAYESGGKPPFGPAQDKPHSTWAVSARYVFNLVVSTGMMVWRGDTGISIMRSNLEYDLDRVDSALSRNHSA
jgi:hypothetical protein